MGNEIETALLQAQASYRRGCAFRRYVDAAVHEAMDHASHIESDVDRRDLHNVAVVAAMAALRLAINSDGLLRTMEAERDSAVKIAKNVLESTPPRWVAPIESVNPPQ